MTTIEQIQTIIGVTVDNSWGPKSQEAIIEASDDQKKEIQTLLGVTSDGEWGVKSQTALNAIKESKQAGTDVFKKTKFSSFADPADVVAFKRCKRTGKTDVQCFAVGDNGVGQFGQITAQEDVPMVAIHGDEMVARWGSRAGAAHRIVLIRLPGGGSIIQARCEDRISELGRVDLNPASAKALGLTPPFVVAGEWKWMEL